MTNRGSLAALLVVAILAGCGYGNRTGFDVPINPEAVSVAGASAIPADLIMASPRAGNIVFSHGVHMIFAEGCEECHLEPWPMKRSSSGTITMEPMYRGESCGVCHDGDRAFSATDCSQCHDLDTATATLPEIKLPGGGFGATEFSHGMHLMAGAACEQCHPEPWTWTVSYPGTMQMGPMYVGESCGECHDGTDVFAATDCARCHDRDNAMQLPRTDGEIRFRGQTIPEPIAWPGADEYGEVVFSHEHHAIAGMTCDRCHPDLYGKVISPAGTHVMEPMYAGQSCGVCHDGVTSFPATACTACHPGAPDPVKAAAKAAPAEAPDAAPEAPSAEG